MIEVLRGEAPADSGYGSGGCGYGGYGGSGYGYGGYGYGYGNGYGDSGSGYGYGGYGGSGGSGDSGDSGDSGYSGYYGYSTGSGSGYGYGSYWTACIPYFLAKLPDDIQSRASKLMADGVRLAYWRSNQEGRPANGGRGVVATQGVIHEEKGPLSLCAPGTLHATLIPTRWKGNRWWIVALHGDVIGDDEKMGCLRREILGECL